MLWFNENNSKFRKHKLCTLVPKWTIVLMIHCSSFDFDVMIKILSTKSNQGRKGFFDLQFQITVHPRVGVRNLKPDIHSQEQRADRCMGSLLTACSFLQSFKVQAQPREWCCLYWAESVNSRSVHGPTQTTEFFKDYLRVILGCGRLAFKIILTTIYSSIDVITIFSYKIFPFIII